MVMTMKRRLLCFVMAWAYVLMPLVSFGSIAAVYHDHRDVQDVALHRLDTAFQKLYTYTDYDACKSCEYTHHDTCKSCEHIHTHFVVSIPIFLEKIPAFDMAFLIVAKTVLLWGFVILSFKKLYLLALFKPPRLSLTQ